MKNELEEEDFHSGTDNLILIKEVTNGRIFISKGVIQIPIHLKDTPKFKDLIAKRDTQTYTATYSFIDEVYSSEEQSEVDKELVTEFRKNHPEGYSLSNEKIVYPYQELTKEKTKE